MNLKLLPPGQRKGKKPHASYIVVGWWEGKAFERSLHTKNPDEAEARFDELKVELRRQKASGAGLFTFDEAVKLYRATHQVPDQPKKSGLRWGLDKWLIDVNRELGSLQASKITNPDIHRVAFKLYPKAANATRNRQVITPVASVLHNAAEAGKVPWLRVKHLPEPVPMAKAVLPSVYQALRAGTDGHKRALIVFLFTHGWRIGECLRLQWSELDLETGMIARRDRKGNTYTWGPLHPDAATEFVGLVEKQQRVGKVFSWGDHHNVQRWLTPLCNQLGLPHFTPHMARHSVATWARNAGASDLDIMGTYGWKDIKSVLRYGRITTERAAEVLSMAKRKLESK